jgi:hypothetical protein
MLLPSGSRTSATAEYSPNSPDFIVLLAILTYLSTLAPLGLPPR